MVRAQVRSLVGATRDLEDLTQATLEQVGPRASAIRRTMRAVDLHVLDRVAHRDEPLALDHPLFAPFRARHRRCAGAP